MGGSPQIILRCCTIVQRVLLRQRHDAGLCSDGQTVAPSSHKGEPPDMRLLFSLQPCPVAYGDVEDPTACGVRKCLLVLLGQATQVTTLACQLLG